LNIRKSWEKSWPASYRRHSRDVVRASL